ncbi:MAG: hypothetical protein CXR31_06090 [Geobacter sp.]|nr:MAG: hypothetical protein CXR31_06090 [Geobacter sp.]
MNNSSDTKSFFIPSIADLVFVVIFLFLSLYDISGMLGDGDTGYHIRAGEYIVRTLSVPTQDIFSFHSPPLPWTAHEWLTEVIMYFIHSVFGLSGVVIFFALLLALTHYFLFRILRSYTTDILLPILVIILVIGSSHIHWLARPHVFSFLLMISWYYLLDAWHRDRMDRLYLLPLLMLLWVNLHGGFLGGFMLLGAYLAGNLFSMLTAPLDERDNYRKKCWQLGLTIGLCLIACLINPRGYHILLFPFKLVSNKYLMDHVSEFLSPNFHQFMPFKYLLFLLIIVLAVAKKRLDAVELVLVLLFTNMALYSARYIPLFAFIVAPLIVRYANYVPAFPDNAFTRFFAHRSRNITLADASAKGCFWPIVAILIVSIAGMSGRIHHSFDSKVKAVEAVEFLKKEHINGNMFDDDEFGDYIIYATWPDYKVFFDGRSDMYGSAMLKEYGKIISFSPGWEELLAKNNITWIIYGTNSMLSRYLQCRSDWRLIYSDKVASIFVKNIPLYAPIIEKYKLTKLAIIEDKDDAMK